MINKRQVTIGVAIILSMVALSAVVAHAASMPDTYTPLSGLTMPNGTEIKVTLSDYAGYLSTMYKMGIGVAITMGFVYFLYAGYEYIGSDYITSKKDANKKMQNAAIGVLNLKI